MILIVVLIAIAAAALVLILWAMTGARTRNYTAEELESRLRQMDFVAFLNLTDPAETAYLARSLEPRRFRRVQRSRIAATFQYLNALSRNSAILVRMGELASQSSDPEIARSGRELSNTALQTRLLVVRAYLHLAPAWLFPSASGGWRPEIAPHYDELKRCLLHLATVQQPSMTSRMAGLL